MEIKKLLLKYDLEDPIILQENPVKKEDWKGLSIKQLILNGKHNSRKQRNYIKIFNT
jgi:hypothetical protein